MFEFPTTELTLKRKRESCEGLEEAEPNAKKQPCWPEPGTEQQVCGQGWWPSQPVQSLQPPSVEVLSDPFCLPQVPLPPQLPLDMQAEAMEMEEEPSQEMSNNNNNGGGTGDVSGTPASQPCLQCMAGQPVSVKGHLLHIMEPQPATFSMPVPPANESISFASHFIPLTLDSLLM